MGCSAPAQGYTVPAQGYTAPAQGYTAPAQGYTAPAQPPATGIVVYTALLFFTESTEDLDLWLQALEATEEAEKRDDVDAESMEEDPDMELRAIIEKLEGHLAFNLRDKKVCPNGFINGFCIDDLRKLP